MCNEGRYKAIVIDRDKYLAAVIRYIHLNPVEAKETDDPKDYPWSSHHHYLGHRTARPWLSVGEVLTPYSTPIEYITSN